MIPLRDENLIARRPIVTWALLAALLGTWIFVQGAGADPGLLARTVCNLGLMPGELTGRAPVGTGVPMGPAMVCLIDNDPVNLLTPLTSMFLHAGWGHVLGNALFLWVFGRAVEDGMGRLRFLAFYLLCGLGAATVQVLMDPASPVPMVGASGAISGILGAYLLLYPRVRVHVLVLVFIVRVPAWMMLLWWVGLQALLGVPSLTAGGTEGAEGVAVWAHLGGFATGLLLVKLFVDPALIEQRTIIRRVLRERLV